MERTNYDPDKPQNLMTYPMLAQAQPQPQPSASIQGSSGGLPISPGDNVELPWGVILIFALAVAALWKILMDRIKSNENNLKNQVDECNKGHKEANGKILELSTRMARVEGEHEGIRGLCKSVLEIVDHNTKNRDSRGHGDSNIRRDTPGRPETD